MPHGDSVRGFRARRPNRAYRRGISRSGFQSLQRLRGVSRDNGRDFTRGWAWEQVAGFTVADLFEEFDCAIVVQPVWLGNSDEDCVDDPAHPLFSKSSPPREKTDQLAMIWVHVLYEQFIGRPSKIELSEYLAAVSLHCYDQRDADTERHR